MGIILAILVACISAANNVLVKKGTANFSLLTVTWAWQAFSLFVIVPALLWSGIPNLNTTFFLFASVNVVIYLGSLFLYSASLRLTDISLAVPMLVFSPIITMIVSYFLSNEVPSLPALLGVLCIIAGAYWINAPKDKKGFLAPIKAIFENKGVLYMFGVAMIWGLSSSFDKVAVVNSSPVFYSAFVALGTTVILTPLILLRHKKEFFTLFQTENLKQLVPLGLLDGVMVLAQMMAVSLTFVAYVIAIKRSSIVISSILGHLMFGEDISSRIKPIVLMFVGILLIVLF